MYTRTWMLVFKKRRRFEVEEGFCSEILTFSTEPSRDYRMPGDVTGFWFQKCLFQ